MRKAIFPFISKHNREDVLEMLRKDGGSSYKWPLVYMVMWSFMYALDGYVAIKGAYKVFNIDFVFYEILLCVIVLLTSIGITGYMSIMTRVVISRSKALGIDTHWQDMGRKLFIENVVWVSTGFASIWGSLYLYVDAYILWSNYDLGVTMLKLSSPFMLLLTTIIIKRAYGFPPRSRHAIFILAPVVIILAFTSYISVYSL